MKVAVRIFNFIIMAVALASMVFLFMPPAFSFNSNIALDLNTFAKFVPETTYTKDIDLVKLLGTDEIQVSIKFSMDAQGISKVMDGNRDNINSYIVESNIDDMLGILHEPVDLITDYSIRTVIKSTIKEEITKQVEEAAQKANSSATAEDIMQSVGINDSYFTNFANALYDSANQDNSTVESVTNVLYEQIDEAMDKAQEFGGGEEIVNPGYTEDTKDQIQENLVTILDQMKLVDSEGHIKKISQISYIYLAEYLHGELQKKGSSSETIDQKAGESSPDYADRLLKTYVLMQMPDAFYQIVGYVSLGLFIGLFVFAFIWLFLFVFTLIKTFTKKPWTMFGPWFWIIGLLQPVLGIGLIVFGKFIFPKINFSAAGLPLKSVIIAPRTYALIPSMIFIGCIFLAIVYLIIKIIAKNEYRQNGGQ